MLKLQNCRTFGFNWRVVVGRKGKEGREMAVVIYLAGGEGGGGGGDFLAGQLVRIPCHQAVYIERERERVESRSPSDCLICMLVIESHSPLISLILCTLLFAFLWVIASCLFWPVGRIRPRTGIHRGLAGAFLLLVRWGPYQRPKQRRANANSNN
jgi:hypothetical protein